MQKTKLTAILMLTIFALTATSIAYALWSENLYINGTIDTSELDWELVQGYLIHLDQGNDWNASWYPEAGFEQLDKDVGSTTVNQVDSDGDGDLDTIVAMLDNVYPWYGEHIAFKVHNNGEIPLKIWKVVFKDASGTVLYEMYESEDYAIPLDLNRDGKADIAIWWGNNFGLQLHPCGSRDISFDITVLQDAPQGQTLIFTIEYVAIQWNEYSVP
jgi:hypothetical protein